MLCECLHARAAGLVHVVLDHAPAEFETKLESFLLLRRHRARGYSRHVPHENLDSMVPSTRSCLGLHLVLPLHVPYRSFLTAVEDVMLVFLRVHTGRALFIWAITTIVGGERRVGGVRERLHPRIWFTERSC